MDYDYCYVGTQEVIYEYLQKNNIKVDLIADGRGGCYFVKPSNR